MRKLFIILSLFLTMLFVSSCATDGVVVYREYPSSYYYYPYYSYGYYGPTYYTYHYPYYHHHHHWYYHNPPKPHNNHTNNHQPAIPPKPTNVPKATVRSNGSGTSGSMSGGIRPGGNPGGSSPNRTRSSGNSGRR